MDIAAIFQDAKDHILEHGEHRPILYLELATGDIDVIVFGDFPFETTQQRKMALFKLGRKRGQVHRGDKVRQICFVIEAWMSRYDSEADAKNHPPPSEDPNRIEAIIATVLDVNNDKLLNQSLNQSMWTAEMIRYKNGKLQDLLPHGKHEGKVNSSLLTSFLAGFVSNELSLKELASVIEAGMHGE